MWPRQKLQKENRENEGKKAIAKTSTANLRLG
jgi:hypothetical protein